LLGLGSTVLCWYMHPPHAPTCTRTRTHARARARTPHARRTHARAHACTLAFSTDTSTISAPSGSTLQTTSYRSTLGERVCTFFFFRVLPIFLSLSLLLCAMRRHRRRRCRRRRRRRRRAPAPVIADFFCACSALLLRLSTIMWLLSSCLQFNI
jgi:hypothetical protein